VGLLGMPNAGKSSLIRQISSARPKVADYPFTTLHPSLGVVSLDDQHIVMADIPGLIENASEGVGLGFEFLKHLSRTKALLHVIDILPADGSDPVYNYRVIEKELEKYDRQLFDKPRIMAINKIDLINKDEQEETVNDFLKGSGYDGEVFQISAINGTGCKGLVYGLFNLTKVSDV